MKYKNKIYKSKHNFIKITQLKDNKKLQTDNYFPENLLFVGEK